MLKRVVFAAILSLLSPCIVSSAVQVPEGGKPPARPSRTLPADMGAAFTADVRQSLLREGGTAVRFDLVCRAHGRVVWERDPPSYRGSPNPQNWNHSFRMIVDLDAMQFCEPFTCRHYGPLPVQALTGYEIVFTDNNNFHESVGAQDGRYEQDHFDLGRLEVTTGRCTRAAFSGFPPVDQDGG